jgi:thiosulfate/3-mercaptopyruvate sulfurtransferase
MKRTMLVAVVVLFAASSAFAFSLGSSKYKDEVEKEAGAVKLVREVETGGYDVITTAELSELIKNGEDVLIIDTMPYEASYKKAHIPNAKQFLFPIPEMAQWDSKETGGKSQEEYLELLGPDKEKKIIIYCGFVKCTRSHNGALWAKNLGYTNVYRYPGGIYAWKGADNEVDVVE